MPSTSVRIAIDCRYIRERPSGIGAYVEALVERLPQLAPENRFDLWAHRLAPRPLSSAPNVSEQCVAVEPNSAWSLWWPERYASFKGADLFHGPHNTLPRGVVCPSVVTMHDLMAIERPDLAFTRWSQRIKRTYYPQAQWRGLRDASRVIVTTSAMASRVRDLCPSARDRIAVVPMAAGALFRPAADANHAAVRSATLLRSDAPFLLVVGQDAPNKRHEVALQAFARGAPVSWRIVFVQRQNHRGTLRTLARTIGVQQRVIWLPTVSADDLVALYQRARALLQPSIYEGFGIPVVEAMSCGCPVIASDIPTLHEVIGNGGILVRPNDIELLSGTIRTLAESARLRDELSAAGLAQSQIYSWDRCARETLGVFREVTSGG